MNRSQRVCHSHKHAIHAHVRPARLAMTPSDDLAAEQVFIRRLVRDQMPAEPADAGQSD